MSGPEEAVSVYTVSGRGRESSSQERRSCRDELSNPGDRPEGIGEGADDLRRTASNPGVTPNQEPEPYPGEEIAATSADEGAGYAGPSASAATPNAQPYTPDEPLAASGVTGSSQSESKSDVAKSEAREVKDTAVAAGSDVADTAKQEVGNVVREASSQARSLLDQLRFDVREQGSAQKDKIASTLRSWSEELGSMASSSEQDGPVTDLARQASRRGGEVARWLDTHEPGDALEEIKRYGRRHPFTFLAICAAAGVVAGRLTRGAVAANTSLDSPDFTSADRALPAGGGYGAEPVASPGPYDVSVGPVGVAEPHAAGASVSGSSWSADQDFGQAPAGSVALGEPADEPPRSTGVLDGPGDSFDNPAAGVLPGEAGSEGENRRE